MTEKEKDDLLKDAVASIGVIKEQFDCEVIRNYGISPLVNMNKVENIGQCVEIMVGDKPVGLAKCGMLTYQGEYDGATNDRGAWENPMRHTFEITDKLVVTNVGDPIHELLNDMPSKVDVEIRRELGKMPRKMKKAYRIGSRYRRDTKWNRKAKAYERRFIYRLPNAEMVVTREQFGKLEAIIKGSELQYNTVRIRGNDIRKQLAAYAKKRQ